MVHRPTRPAIPIYSRRRFLELGAGAAAAVALAGCGSGGGPQNNPAVQGQGGGGGGTEYTGPAVTLAFWNGFTGGDGPVMEGLVEQFNGEHENIDVEMSVREWEDYYANVPAAVRGGEGPDVGIMHVDSLGTNAARGVIVPLDDVASALQLNESDFADVVWQAGVFQDQRYGIPLDMHPLGFYYNRTVMQEAGLDPDQPPQTADDYMAALDELQAAGVEGHWMTPFPFTGLQTFESLLWQFGGELYSEDASQATFNSDAGVQALTWMVDLVRNGHSPADVGQDADSVAFQNGRNAFIWNGIWAINVYNEVPDLDWGVAPLPQIGSQRAAWAGSHNFVLMSQQQPEPQRQEAARVFVNWISQRSIEWAAGGQVPARTSVRESPEFAELEPQAAIAEQVDDLHFVPPVPGIGDVQSGMLEPAISEAVLGRREPQAALDAAAERADQLLAQNLEQYGG